MKRLILILSLLCSAPVWATPTLVNHASGTAATLTVTSTTAGNTVVVIVGSNGATPSVVLGAQSMTQLGACVPHLYSGGTLYDCAFYVGSATGTQILATCTGCTSPNFMMEGEWSGTVSPYVEGPNECTSYAARCQVNGAAAVVGIPFNPGYSSEGFQAIASCSGSSGTPTGSTFAFTGTPNGNPVAWGTTTGTGQIAMIPTSGCGSADGMMVGIIGSGSTQQLTSNQAFQSDSALCTSGACTLTVHVANTGDLFIAPLWCITTCTTGTIALGSQTMTCPSGATGVSDANTGQGRVCYVVTNTQGALTLSWTPGGSPTQYQVLGFDMPISGQTTVAYDTAAFSNCASGCSYGSTYTLPSLTAAGSGELFVSFGYTAHHATTPNSPWGCYIYNQVSGDIQQCTAVSTVNLFSWISAAGSATEAANFGVLDANDPVGSIVAAFEFSSTVSGHCAACDKSEIQLPVQTQVARR